MANRYKLYHSGNANLLSVDWDAKDLILNGEIRGATNGYFSGDLSITGTTITTGLLTANGGISIPASHYLTIGSARLVYDSGTNSIYLIGSDGTTEVNFYATGSVSAYKLGESGNGGSYNRMDIWPEDITGHETDVLGATLGVELNTRVSTIENTRTFVFNQGTISNVWNITHNLNKYPSVSITDTAGTEVEGQVDYLDLNSVKVTFAYPFSGRAVCN